MVCLTHWAASAVEGTWEYAVQVSATVQTLPPLITLTWPQDVFNLPTDYTVYRKAIEENSWGYGTVLPGASTSYVDSQVSDSAAYEYQIIKHTAYYTGYGYIYAGINAPLADFRGTVMLVVE